MTDNQMIVYDAATAIQQVKSAYQIVIQMQKDILKSGIDYGVIPGSDKPTLHKPGAEKLCTAFGFRPRFKALSITEDFERGLFFYRYECTLVHIQTGLEIGCGIGSCSTFESKYRWRWMEAYKIPPHMDKATLEKKEAKVWEPVFAINKADTSGKWGKPAEYWQKFNDAIANRTAKSQKKKMGEKEYEGWEIDSTLYRVPNTDVIDQVNTVDKMAQKRAMIAAVLVATNASEFFTQDIEDLPDFSDVIEGQYTVQPEPAPKPAQPKTPPTAKDNPNFAHPPKGKLDATVVFRKALNVFNLRADTVLKLMEIKSLDEFDGTEDEFLDALRQKVNQPEPSKSNGKSEPEEPRQDPLVSLPEPPTEPDQSHVPYGAFPKQKPQESTERTPADVFAELHDLRNKSRLSAKTLKEMDRAAGVPGGKAIALARYFMKRGWNDKQRHLLYDRAWGKSKGEELTEQEFGATKEWLLSETHPNDSAMMLEWAKGEVEAEAASAGEGAENG